MAELGSLVSIAFRKWNGLPNFQNKTLFCVSVQ